MTQQLLTNPIRLADRALTMLSTEQRADLDILEFYELSEQIVVRWSDDRHPSTGFGSSDRTFMLRDLLESSGFKTRFVNHRLAVMAS
jgi:hypothetical protein